MIAPVPLHPVIEVLVVPGDRVKKGQPLVKLDDDEAQADVRAKKATLEATRLTLQEARRTRDMAQQARGSVPEALYNAMCLAVTRGEQEERAARAALEASQAELEHYVVMAPINGVVAWLDVHPRMVSRPGTSLWGEVLDLGEVDVRCELTPDQVEAIAAGQAAEVRARKRQAEVGSIGRVVFVGVAADKVSGLVPVVVRVPNPKGWLRCEVPVQVRFTEALPAK
jgi:membrane fusion protein (multidrug efflux system)